MAAAYGLSMAAVAALVASNTDAFKVDVGDLNSLVGDNIRDLLGDDVLVGILGGDNGGDALGGGIMTCQSLSI